MKKIFLLALIFISFKACSQRQPQSLGSPNTDVYSKGTIGSDSGHVFRVCRSDTTAWNFGLIKNIPGVVVRTCDDLLWLRNNTAVKWILIGTGAGATDSSFIIIDSTYDDLAYSPNVDSMFIKSLRLQLNGVTITPTSDNLKLSYNIIAGSTQTLQQVFDTEIGGSVLTKSDTIVTAANTLFISTSTFGITPLDVYSTTGRAINSTSDNNSAFYGSTTDGYGLTAYSSGNGIGARIQSDGASGLPLQVVAALASTNTVAQMLRIDRYTLGTAGNGIGGSIDFLTNTTTSNDISNRLISKWTDATDATRTSQAILTGVTNAVTQNWLTLSSGGALRLDQYGAGTLTTDGSGNVTATSDVRLKNVKGKFRSGLSAVMNINPIVYKWNDKSGFDTKNNYIGFSAQNIQTVLGDDAVGHDSQGYLSIQDRAIMAALVNAVKEQQKEIESLQKQINALK